MLLVAMVTLTCDEMWAFFYYYILKISLHPLSFRLIIFYFPIDITVEGVLEEIFLSVFTFEILYSIYIRRESNSLRLLDKHNWTDWYKL